MVIAGFRPDTRGPFVLAKGPKTIDAQFGLIKMAGRKLGRVGKLAELVLRYIEGLKQCPPMIRGSIQGAELQASNEGKRGKWKFPVAQ